MADLGFIPKHTLIANRIREEILAGRIREGERLRPDTELAAEYGVNKRTVANGMAQLVAEGLISRAPKRGSVVVRREIVARTSNAVGVVSHNEGHVYADIAGEITEQLLKRSFYPVWITQSIFHRAVAEPEYKPFGQMLEHLLNDCPQGMIVNGERFVPIDLLARNRRKIGELVFICHYLHEQRIPAKYVLIDHAAAARKIVRHLAENGHRSMTMLPIHQRFGHEYGKTVQDELLRSLKKAAAEAGVAFDLELPEKLIASGEPEAVIREFFPERGITAAVVPFDSVWSHTYSGMFRKLGVEAPRDLSLVGYYNTPWAETTVPRLTSVNIFERKIARLAVEMLLNEIPDTEIMVEPELVIRDSVRNLN